MTINISPASVRIDTGSTAVVPAQAISQPDGFYLNVVKRGFDLVVAALLLVLSLPLMIVCSVFIALDGHSPVYSQLRVGKDGKTFRMWKLRTMVHGAEDLLETHLASNAAARIEWNATQKLKKDPRVTLIGRILRKTSLDELPQLINILNGTMSVVGPRPMMVSQKGSYRGRAYYDLRPGLTGLWQISDRNDSDFAERVRFDDHYSRIVSIKTDTIVVLKTVLVVLRGTGY